MNDPLRSVDREALEALRAVPTHPSSAARARAREAFVRAPRRRRRRPWLAAAAAVAAMLVLWTGTRPDGPWIVRAVDGPPVITRHGVDLDLDVGERFVAGAITTGDSTEIEIERGALHLRVRPGTDARIPAPPGRWFSRERSITVTRGEVFGSSGTAGPGFPLVLRTPEATARLTGTTFAVFRTDDATCFCLYRGGLEVTPHGSAPIELPVGRRIFVYDDGRPPSIEPLDAGETMKLRMIDDAARRP